MENFKDPAEFARQIQGRYLNSAMFYDIDGTVDADTVSADEKDRLRPSWETIKWHPFRGNMADPGLAAAVDAAGIGLPLVATIWSVRGGSPRAEKAARLWGANFTGIGSPLASPATAMGIVADSGEFTKILDGILGEKGELASVSSASVEPGRTRPVHRLELLGNFLMGVCFQMGEWCPLNKESLKEAKRSAFMRELEDDILPAVCYKGREERVQAALKAFSGHPGYVTAMNPCKDISPRGMIAQMVADMACLLIGADSYIAEYKMPRPLSPALLQLFDALAVSEVFVKMTADAGFEKLSRRVVQFGNLSPYTWAGVADRIREAGLRFRAARALQISPEDPAGPEPSL
jgi:hypothetical protein